MPVVVTEYQSWPSAVLSRATTRAQRESSATERVEVRGAGTGCVLIVIVVFSDGSCLDRASDLRWPHSDPCPQIGRVPARSCRSEEHTSELQSLAYLVCRLLLEKKKKKPSKRLTPKATKKGDRYAEQGRRD